MSKSKFSRIILYLLAWFGAISLCVLGSLLGLRELLNEDTREAEVPAPSGPLKVARDVSRGGFGTVYTTSLIVEDDRGESLLIYKNRDSDYKPPVAWTDAETLEVTIHCGRINHMGNNAGWIEGDTPIQRFRVKFLYDEQLCADPEGDE